MGGILSVWEADIGSTCRQLSNEFEYAMYSATCGGRNQRLLGKYEWTQPYRLPTHKYKNKGDPRMRHIMRFYDDNVPISDQDWITSCIIVNYVLEILEIMLKKQTQHPCLKVDEFIPSGSSCEGLKVGEADEFDVLVPIRICDQYGRPALTFRETYGTVYIC